MLIGVAVEMLIGAAIALYVFWPRPAQWSAQELATLRSLSLATLASLPPDPSNAVAGDPRAVTLGHKLFFDPRFSANGEVSCATCHQPDRMFVDGLPLAKGIGTNIRKTQALAGVAYGSWFFWDGRADSLWAQALGPLENPVEHGGTRVEHARLIYRHYRAEYEALFGSLPDIADERRFPAPAAPIPDPLAAANWDRMAAADRDAVSRVYANLGKAIAAYERLLLPGPAPFDDYVRMLLDAQDDEGAILSPDERAGLRLFIGRAECINCHNGPLFSTFEFHANGAPTPAGLPFDPGRAVGVEKVRQDEFNCLGPYSDARPEQCTALRFMISSGPELVGSFKAPSLRNVALTAPYMHAGQFATLRTVLEHYNRAPTPSQGHSDIHPLYLSDSQLSQLEAFLRALTGPLTTPAALLRAPAR